MATLLNVREYYYRATARVSDNIRTLTLSEIGIIWLFKISDPDKIVFPEGLVFPLVFCISALCLDFMQYLYQSIAWDIKKTQMENSFKSKGLEIDINKQFKPMNAINVPSTVFFYGKAIFFLISYIGLLLFLISKINFK